MYAIRSYYEQEKIGASYTYLTDLVGDQTEIHIDSPAAAAKTTAVEFEIAWSPQARTAYVARYRITSYNVCYTKLLRGLPRLIDRLPNRHTKANDLVHDFDPSQDFAHLGVVIPQAQFRPNELLEAVHGSLGLRTLVIAAVLFPLFQLAGFERFDGFVAGMTRNNFV